MSHHLAAAALLLALGAGPEQGPPGSDPEALALVDSAIARTGGAALHGIHRIRYDATTQWLRPNADRRPFRDYPSLERHADVRDYTMDAWRNTRDFGARSVVDIVRGDVGSRTFDGPQPMTMALNIAYVDERLELFLYSGDRVLLAARSAPDLRLLDDTVIGDVVHARVQGTMHGQRATLHLRRSDGLPAMLAFRAAHPNDYGLVPLGEMDVEVWYSQWRPDRTGVTLPWQWDVMRAGSPYKRTTIRSAVINPELAADSFMIGDSIADVFRRTQRRPMHDVPFDSAAVVDTDFVKFGAWSGFAGAVRVGGAWVLLETGQAPLSAERGIEWLERNAGGSVAAAIVGNTSLGNGGVVHASRIGLPTYAAPGARWILDRIFSGYEQSPRVLEHVTEPRWIRIGSDSVRIEPLDLPDAPGTLVMWVPSLRYVYSPMAITPLDMRLLLAHARRNGWQVERVGGLRTVVMPVPPSP